jgi:ABC-type amino acid transport substrate-binding protein
MFAIAGEISEGEGRVTKSTKWTLIAVVALLAAIVAGAGCGGDDEPSTNTGTELKTIKPGELTVGSDIPYKPFEFGREGDYQGFDVDLVTEIGNKLNLETTFVKTPFDTIFRNLAQGKFDMVATASTISAEREKQVDFSDPYFPADQSLMVKKGSDIKTVDDLEGKVIGAQLGTTGADYAKENTKAKTIRTYDLIDDAFNALESGQVEAVINDCPVSKYAERAHTNLTVVRSIETNEQYGLAFPSGSDALREAVNEQLAELKKNGKLAEIQNKWLGTDPCKGLPGSEGEGT